MLSCPNSLSCNEHCYAHLSEEKYREIFELEIEGVNRRLPADVRLPTKKPEWYSEQLLLKGQEFASKYYASVCFGQLLGLCTLFTFTRSLKPLIYTRKSDTVKEACVRYMSTAFIIKSWYEGDLWDSKSAASKNMLLVRQQHFSISKKMNSANKEEIAEKCILSKLLDKSDIKASLYSTVNNDFTGFCPSYYSEVTDTDIYFNQSEMSLTLFGFMGLVVYSSEKFGIPTEKEEEGLTGFIHLWRVIGYLLGVEDNFNFCKGDIKEVREKCDKIIKGGIFANFENVNEEWEHMSRCAVEGLNLAAHGGYQFEVTLLYLFWVLDVKTDNLNQKLSWKTKCQLFALKLFFSFFYKLSFLRDFLNARLKSLVTNYQEKQKN